MAKGLGKGLGALMGDFSVETPSAKSPYQMLPIHKVEPNPTQPRRDFDPEELQSLADSIALHGVVQPLTVREVENGYCYEAYTEKGKALVANWPGEETDADVEAVKADIRAKIAEQPFANLSLKGIEDKAQMELFNSPKWEKLSMACLGCGSCTFSCPTCQCYDIRDYDSGNGIQRYRCWDSCMYSDFTMMAHGTNRPTQTQRYRQRFMHKLAYFPENNEGMYSCVGCGRCVRKCPMNLNIAKVIKALGEETK